ncbi:hypothetical protein [Pragia fontium]|uniref:hypothetical protein n=1 Tax=Pragia fontium TaxID=82985 RepID=UPI000F827ECD|nr:hypothetical protein [Pragia fontium]
MDKDRLYIMRFDKCRYLQNSVDLITRPSHHSLISFMRELAGNAGCNRYLCGLMLFVLSCYGQATQLGEYFDSLPVFDKVYFLCETDKGKYISLYGGLNAEKKPISLFYTYGYKNKPEIIYPSSTLHNNFLAFEYQYYSRPFTSYLFISFNNKGYRYTLKDSLENDIKSVSLGVKSIDRDKEHSILCKKIIVDELYAIADRLPCNKKGDGPFFCLGDD